MWMVCGGEAFLGAEGSHGDSEVIGHVARSALESRSILQDVVRFVLNYSPLNQLDAHVLRPSIPSCRNDARALYFIFGPDA